MSNIIKSKPTHAAAIAVLVASAFTIPFASAEDNPFQTTDLSSGYVVADVHAKQKKMKKMDTDGDGSISKDEFMAYSEKKFAKKDKNGDGVLSADEMKRKKKYGEGKY